MEEKFNEATTQRPQGDRTIDAPLVAINLLYFIEQIRNEQAWKDSDRNAITVFKTNGMRIVLIALHKGAEMIKHTADGLISVQVLEGQMLFNTNEQSVNLGKGQMLALHKGIAHSVVAKEETIFLLTLTTSLQEK
ncbi:MAG: cupin domain-containing protein [Bacteroidia bacterium]|nr:cupin domain-containing protein [Bacteroidia bacterium]